MSGAKHSKVDPIFEPSIKEDEENIASLFNFPIVNLSEADGITLGERALNALERTKAQEIK